MNALTGQKRLARISKTPGRTQLINYFQLGPAQRLVDLPGYGYAKVPLEVKQHWQALLGRYLQRRAALRGLVILMDVRHPLTALDVQLLDWCQQRQLASHVVLTKADKLKRGPAKNTLLQIQRTLHNDYSLASVQLFSALTGQGLDALQATLDQWLFSDAP